MSDLVSLLEPAITAEYRFALLHAAGRVQEAITLFEPLLTQEERILDAGHPTTLATRNNLAVAYQDAGRVGEAIAIFEPVLAERERVLGPAHPDTLATRENQ